MNEIDQAQIVNDTYLPGYLYMEPPSPLRVHGYNWGPSDLTWQTGNSNIIIKYKATQDGMLCLLNVLMNFMLATGPWVSDVTTKEMERPPSKNAHHQAMGPRPAICIDP